MPPHKLVLKESSPYRSGTFTCNVCWEKGSGPVYHCSLCQFDVHVACAATAKEQTHFIHHQHPLHLCRPGSGHTCDGCGKKIHEWAFRCSICDFDMHSLCVRAPRFIVHPSHRHPLNFTRVAGLVLQCDGCEEYVHPSDKFVYRCSTCNYALHQSCASLSGKIHHPMHPLHALSLDVGRNVDRDFAYTCSVCHEGGGNGWWYYCTACNFYLHYRCAKVSHELPHSGSDSPTTTMTTPSRSSSSLAATSTCQRSNNGTIDVTQEIADSARSRPTLVHEMKNNVLPMPVLNSQDLEAVERVLSFAKEMLSRNMVESSSEVLESCPTCFEGYVPGNPKKTTKCGHNFHLACILQWMERSDSCPICRQHLSLLP